MNEHELVILLVSVVALGVASQWLAWRLQIPAIVLLAVAGLVAGPISGLVNPAEDFGDLFRPAISLCVAIILFEGGLNLSLSDLKQARTGVRRLVYLGAPLAWGFCTASAYFVGGLSLPVSMVFGAIMVVTGPTVIMPLLRQARLNRRTASYLKWEGIVNDPLGALLAVLVFQFFMYAGEGSSWLVVIKGVGMALLAGVALGGLLGWLTGAAFRRGMVPEFLKSPVMLSAVLGVYAIADTLQNEAGLLAVTIMGMVVGNMDLPGISDMKRFKEYITVMLVSVVFVMLTADLDFALLASVNWRAVLLIMVVLFVARPIAIMLATSGSDMLFEDRILLGWIAPRGIVAAATAGLMGPRMAAAGYTDANVLLPLVFLVIFASVFLHGSSIGWLARRLGLASKERDSVLIVGASPWGIELARTLESIKVKVMVADNSWHNLRPARLAGLSVFYGEILSEFAEESVEISHIQTVLAATSNDAYNALVCTTVAPEIGRDKVFQLPMGSSAEDDPRALSRPRRGRIAFDSEALFEQLWRWHVRGWIFYKTRLTDSYSYSDFLGDYPSDAIKILLLEDDGKVRILDAENQVEPQPGDVIVYYGPKRAEREDEPKLVTEIEV
ncbi:MAG: cation:proton antiporter [Gammaproteobacteria bacterium]|nr:cation:proton antiporter [Gammaproteobacteria bacterium]